MLNNEKIAHDLTLMILSNDNSLSNSDNVVKAYLTTYKEIKESLEKTNEETVIPSTAGLISGL
ncbi:MAG: hypothetical protein SOY88_00155 [Massilioclostridium sp.]|nr:hypothetical protein [Massilioclostridium sp.]